VLEGMQAFEHGERGIAPRATEARDERSVLHAPIIPATMSQARV